MTDTPGPLSTLSRSIAGQVAIVTGAASGMGRATARLLAEQGAHVAAWDVAADAVNQVAAEIEAAGFSAHAQVVDVADAAAIEAGVAGTRARFGPIDILVNNAGVVGLSSLHDPTFEDTWAHTLEVNLNAQVRLIRACREDLIRDGAGRIVNIASTEGLGGSAHCAAYGATKHAVVGLTKSVAMELGRDGVTCNAVCPGPIHTGMTAVIDDESKAIFARRRTAVRRYGDPEEVAHVTLSLVLPAASFITAAAIPVDGGMRARNN